ncbi:serine racemase isoform X2 [Lasioglossum baleicum]|uniref:serine racemase isoform X2 n=1 Tax=Lasioglossum baleicum TaxID=434251 RepID=UPI003FCCD95D
MRDLNRKQNLQNGPIESSCNGDLDLHSNEELVDPFCVEENPQKITFEDITSAAFKIKCGIINTPCVRSRLSDQTGIDLYLKKDFLQRTGSFKERGARHALMMLTDEQKKIGVISASLGNHALALCYHGHKLGIPVAVVMPVVAPIMKIAACRQYGAKVIVEGRDMGEAKRIALKYSKDEGMVYINGYDHPDIMAGQGTLGLEIVEQVPDIDAIVVPVGGGGLIAGVALAAKTLHPNITIIGVESERCPSFYAARKSERPIYTPIESTLADGLAVPMVGYNAFATANPLIDRLVVVKEEWIAIAILKLVESEKCIVEGAGATGLAAILAGQLDELKGKRVVLPLCGGNIDTTILGRCLERGLVAEGRLMKFTVTVSDRPGGISELCKILAGIGVSIKDIMHERAWIMSDVFSVDVKVVCETIDREHAEQLKKMLNQNYKKVLFGTSEMCTLNS